MREIHEERNVDMMKKDDDNEVAWAASALHKQEERKVKVMHLLPCNILYGAASGLYRTSTCIVNQWEPDPAVSISENPL
jgi:hypothetical protein